MKRRGKVILLSISVVILLLIIFNFNEIKFGLNMAKSLKDDPKEEQELTEEEKDLLEGKTNPLILVLEKEGIVLDDEDLDEDESVSEEASKEKDESQENKEDDKKDKAQKEDEYVDTLVKYNGKLSALQSDFESKLGGLISQGYSEYQAGVPAGKLAPKYLSQGASLEAECDREFYSMIGELESQVDDPELIGELKSYYNSYKDAKRSEIMSKARGHL